MEMEKKEMIEAVFREHADHLYAFALTRVNDEGTARDLVQDTFVSALKNVETFRQQSKFSTWLTAILKNKIIDHYRKKAKEFRKESLEGLATSEDYFDARGHWKKDQAPGPWSSDANSTLEKKEFHRILKACLARLREIQRIAFVMKHMDGAETETICKELEITASNYWVIIHRAKLQLRKCMETHWINA